MELRTDSGVSITIIEAGSSRVLIFDKSVRAVELNKEEVYKISASLISKSKIESSGTNSKRMRSKDKSKAGLSLEAC